VKQSAETVTQLLLAWSAGDGSALEKLTPLVYDELHELANRYMRRENEGHVLQATALVNEAYIRLVDSSQIKWQNRAHFLAVAAQAMRRILVDFARSRDRQKRGGQWQQQTFDEELAITNDPESDLVALDAALQDLAKVDPRKANVVELRFFGGLSLEEAAEALSISTDTVGRDWNVAKAWLLRELKRDGACR
jgi:RNA polymerase sigma factor (TIGR02999 family)